MPKLSFQMPKLSFQMPELPFQKPELRFQMPELRFQMPELRFQMPELRFQMPELSQIAACRRTLRKTTGLIQFFSAVTYWKGRCHLTPNATVARSNQSLAVISAIQQSPSQQPSPGSTLTPPVSRKRKNSSNSTHRPKERMHHNIPHRYV